MVSVGNSVSARPPGIGLGRAAPRPGWVVTAPTATSFGTFIKVKGLLALVRGASLPRRACAEARPPEFHPLEQRIDLLAEESTR